jgi:hypothetical protein
MTQIFCRKTECDGCGEFILQEEIGPEKYDDLPAPWIELWDWCHNPEYIQFCSMACLRRWLAKHPRRELELRWPESERLAWRYW